MKKFIAVLTILILPLIVLRPILSVGLADPSDIFEVQSPLPNQKLKGTVEVRWMQYDDEQSQIQYQTGIYDPGTCSTTFYGKVTNNTTGNSSSANPQVLNWNTTATSTISPLPDGQYCFKVCASMLNGTTPYSTCNSRYIFIYNTNRKPTITSTPVNLTLTEGQTFTYDVQATDPDNDALVYFLSKSPGFLSINSSNGLITSAPFTTVNGQTTYYTAEVTVDDDKAGSVTQSFVITVNPKPVTPPPSGGTTTPPPTTPPQGDTDEEDQGTDEDEDQDDEDTEDETPVETEFSAEFIKPHEDTIYTSEDSLISWRIDNSEMVTNQVLSYSDDLEEWFPIQEFEPSINYYIWDISNIKNGSYYLKLELIGSDDTQKFSATSEKFMLQFNEDGDLIESVPLIIDVEPEDGAEVSNDFRNIISGKFIPSAGAEIQAQTFNIQLDGEDIKETCQADDSSFNCRLAEELNTGRHEVKVSISDSNDKEAEYEWTFTVSGAEVSEGGEVVNILGQEIPRSAFFIGLLILGIILALLLIPWILYSLWRGGNDEYVTTTTVTPIVPDYRETYLAPIPEVNVYQTPVETQTIQSVQPIQPYTYEVPTTTYNTTYTEPIYPYYPETPTTTVETYVQPVVTEHPQPVVTFEPQPVQPVVQPQPTQVDININPVQTYTTQAQQPLPQQPVVDNSQVQGQNTANGQPINYYEPPQTS